jgi:hypothetical protein
VFSGQSATFSGLLQTEKKAIGGEKKKRIRVNKKENTKSWTPVAHTYNPNY